MASPTNISKIGMMELRSQPGTYIDRVFYRRERFVVERSGEARAVLVPLEEYNQMEQIREENRKQFFTFVDKLRDRMGGENPEEIQAAIDEVVQAIREENKRATPYEK